MNARFGAVLIVLLALAQTLSAQQARFGGTFIGAVVCSDGIVIGADSRSTFIDGDGRHIGYVDGISKVFTKQGTAFAVSGLTSVGDELFPTFVRRNDFLLTRPSNEVLFGVSLWLPVDNASQVLLISAGFVDDKPMICVKGPTNPQVCRDTGVITNKPSPSLKQWQSTLNSMPSYQEAARALKQAILESAAADPTVGGPVALLHLRNNAAPEWIENGTQDSGWTKVCDIVTDYRHNRTVIGFTNSKEELDRFLSSICSIHK